MCVCLEFTFQIKEKVGVKSAQMMFEKPQG